LSDAKDEEAKKRQGLLNFYNEVESFMEKMDGSILALLQQNVGNIKEKMKNRKVQLQQKGYFLLVAGRNSLTLRNSSSSFALHQRMQSSLLSFIIYNFQSQLLNSWLSYWFTTHSLSANNPAFCLITK